MTQEKSRCVSNPPPPESRHFWYASCSLLVLCSVSATCVNFTSFIPGETSPSFSHLLFLGVSRCGYVRRCFCGSMRRLEDRTVSFGLFLSIGFCVVLIHCKFLQSEAPKEKCALQCLLQYINPIVKNSQHRLKGNLLYAIESVLKHVETCPFHKTQTQYYSNIACPPFGRSNSLAGSSCLSQPQPPRRRCNQWSVGRVPCGRHEAGLRVSATVSLSPSTFQMSPSLEFIWNFLARMESWRCWDN
ncbi:hypothetical protein I3843_03G243100 [Carya illinoinensis]|nr:hypothetical protein I3843_03G243100 [Carya illinoinensis]